MVQVTYKRYIFNFHKRTSLQRGYFLLQGCHATGSSPVIDTYFSVPKLLVITGYDFAENTRISIDAYLDVALIDLPWDPNLAVKGSDEYNDLVDVFNNQVGFGLCLGCLLSFRCVLLSSSAGLRLTSV